MGKRIFVADKNWHVLAVTDIVICNHLPILKTYIWKYPKQPISFFLPNTLHGQSVSYIFAFLRWDGCEVYEPWICVWNLQNPDKTSKKYQQAISPDRKPISR